MAETLELIHMAVTDGVVKAASTAGFEPPLISSANLYSLELLKKHNFGGEGIRLTLARMIHKTLITVEGTQIDAYSREYYAESQDGIGAIEKAGQARREALDRYLGELVGPESPGFGLLPVEDIRHYPPNVALANAQPEQYL
jgi:hypothetical protein